MAIDIETLIQSTIFPIAMCSWFMFRTEKIISENTKATTELRDAILSNYQNLKEK